MLLASGASALVWWRLCVAQGADPPVEASAALGDAYRFHALEATLRARDLRRVVTTLRQAGVEPLLMKGWAAAQAYPELGLRPYSDIDLFVQPEWHARAARALADLGPRGTPVDLHAVIPDMPDRTPEVLYARSRELSLDGMPVRVLGPEDHLRFLCLHLLRHGVRRPLWLCDVGAAVEALPPDFDAAVCLEGELRRSEWVTCVLQLAHRLLGARLDGWPAKVRDPAPPHWTGATVLRTWGGPYVPHASQRFTLEGLGRPASVLASVRERWPSPLEATYWLGGPTTARLRLPWQLRAFCGRALTWVKVADLPTLKR